MVGIHCVMGYDAGDFVHGVSRFDGNVRHFRHQHGTAESAIFLGVTRHFALAKPVFDDFDDVVDHHLFRHKYK